MFPLLRKGSPVFFKGEMLHCVHQVDAFLVCLLHADAQLVYSGVYVAFVTKNVCLQLEETP